MTHDIMPRTDNPDTGLSPVTPWAEDIRRLVNAATASNTRKAYAARLKRFASWCQAEGFRPFPTEPETLAAYIASLAKENKGKGMSCALLTQTLAALAVLHRAKGLTSPTESPLVKTTVKGYKREHGTAVHSKTAATLDVVRAMLETTLREPPSPRTVRDAAIIALGFSGAFRRSELVALNVDDLEWTTRHDEDVLLVTVRRSKTDQEGQGMVKVIFPGPDRLSPTRLIRRWLAFVKDGALFRKIHKSGMVTGHRLDADSVRIIVRNAAVKAGFGPNPNFSAHSLRSGFVTTAVRQGKSERSIMHQTGHKSVQVLRAYFQQESVFDDNAAQGLWSGA